MGEKQTLKIAHLKITDHLILGIAKALQDKNPDAFQKFVLEPQAKVGWNEIGDTLQKGDVDGAFILAPFAIDLFKNKTPIKLVLFGHRNGSILVRNEKAGVKNIEDFKGKMVILPYLLSVHCMLFNKLLEQKGLSMGPGKDVAYEVMAPGQMVDALSWDEEGELGGFIVAEPFGSQCIKKGIGQELSLSKDLWPNHPCCVLVMRDEALATKHDAVMEFTKALVSSGKFVQEKPKEAAIIGAPFLGQEVDVVEKVLTTPPDRITTDRLFPTVSELKEMVGYFSEKLGKLQGNIDLDTFVNTTYAEAAGAQA